MSKYLDPKTDIVFKKIFGEHPKLLKSFLNALLPLPEDSKIETLEYLSNEQVPVIPSFKYTVVDVNCRDQKGRSFIVEMQIQWTTSFKQRMLFNASKAYVRQLEKGEKYHLLKPVYGLGLINTEFDPNPDYWYHHYKIVNVERPSREIKDLQLVFVELPKFKAKTFKEKKLQVLWLRFMSELSSKTKEVPEDWLRVPEIKQALDLAEESAYSPAELEAYDKYWDALSIEKSLVSDAREESRQETEKAKRETEEAKREAEEAKREAGEAKREAGEAKREAEEAKREAEEAKREAEEAKRKARQEEKFSVAKKLLDMGMQLTEVTTITGLATDEIYQFLQDTLDSETENC